MAHIKIPARELRPGDLIQVCRGSTNYILARRVYDDAGKVAVWADECGRPAQLGPSLRFDPGEEVSLSRRGFPL